MRRRLIVAAALGVALVAVDASAAPRTAGDGPDRSEAPRGAPSASREEAALQWRRGIAFFDEESYDAARLAFERAYALAPSPRLQFDIGQACWASHDWPCALAAFRQYLASDEAIAPPRRAQVERDVQTLGALVGALTLTTDTPGALVTVDDRSVGVAPVGPLDLVVGPHRLEITSPGGETVARMVDVRPGQATTLHVALRPPPPVVVVPPPPAAPSRFTTAAWVGVGVGSALLAAGAVTLALDVKARSDFFASSYTGPDGAALAEHDRARVRTLAVATDVLVAAGAVTLTTALALTLGRTPSRRADRARIEVAAAPSALVVQGAF